MGERGRRAGESGASPSLSGMSVLWERLTGTQPVPPVWVVAVAGLAALAVVLDVRLWHVTRNAITIAHEGGHALLSVLSGRRLEGIRLHSDTSGETVSRGKRTGPGMVLTAFAGYVTPPLLGAGAAVLLFTHHVTLLLWAFLALLLAAFVMMRNAFGIVVALVAGGAVFGVTAYATSLAQALFSYGVAWFLLFGGLRPVVELARSQRQGPAAAAGRGVGRGPARAADRGARRGVGVPVRARRAGGDRRGGAAARAGVGARAASAMRARSTGWSPRAPSSPRGCRRRPEGCSRCPGGCSRCRRGTHVPRLRRRARLAPEHPGVAALAAVLRRHALTSLLASRRCAACRRSAPPPREWLRRHAHRLTLVLERRAGEVRLLASHVSAYGTRTVRSPGRSSRVQASSTSASGIVFALTAIAPLLIASTSDGSSAR